VPALDVLHAYIAAFPVLIVLGIFAAVQQHAYQPIQRDPVGNTMCSGNVSQRSC